MKSIPHYDCDFYSDAFIEMPHYHYTKMRQLGPVVYIPQLNNFAITKFKALKKALFDFESLCSGDGIAADEVGCKYVKGQIVSTDPPVPLAISVESFNKIKKASILESQDADILQVIKNLLEADDAVIDTLKPLISVKLVLVVEAASVLNACFTWIIDPLDIAESGKAASPVTAPVCPLIDTGIRPP